MKVISILNNKGGVGKTASITTIGHMMSQQGKKVLLVDVDPQGNTSAMYDTEADFFKMFLAIWNGNWGNKDRYSIEDALLDSSLDIHKCIYPTKYENLDFIPAYLTLAEVENLLKADVRTPQQFRLAKHLSKIDKEYDYCLIDCSPSINILNINALVASDEVYIPTRTDGNSCLGIAISYNLISTVQEYNPKLKVGGCFFTQFVKNKNVSTETFQFLHSVLPEGVLLPITIGNTKFLEQNSFQAVPLLEADSGKNKSKATRAYMKLVNYMMADDKQAYLQSDELAEERAYMESLLGMGE